MRMNEKHLANFASCKDAPDKEGWLWKKGELNTSYQRRWCVLRGNLLFYFEKRYDSSFFLYCFIAAFAFSTSFGDAIVYAVAHLAWKKGSVAEGQLLILLFSIKSHFLLRLEID